jgi:small-conductance mechanosensitive channel
MIEVLARTLPQTRDPRVRIQLWDELLKVASWATVATALILTVVALARSSLRLDGLGLARSLPPTYYVGLACLPLASGIQWLRGRRANAPIMVLHVALFVLVVWLTPLVLEGTPRFRTSFTNYGYVDPVVRGIGLLPDRFIYHNWPLFPLGMATLVQLTGISELALMAIFPLVMMLAYLVPLAAILWIVSRYREQRDQHGPTTASQVRSATWPVGLWLFAVFDWTNQDYFSPQAVAFLVFLIWLAVLVYVILREAGRPSSRSTIALLGLFAVLVVTHVLTSLEVLGVLAAVSATRLVRRPTIALTCTLMFIAWQFNVAGPFFTFYADRLQNSLLDIADFAQANVASRVKGSPEHSLIAELRIIVTAVVFALGGLAALIQLGRRPGPRAVLLGVVVLVGIALVAPASVYGGEMVIRVLLFSLPMLAGLAVTAFVHRAYRLLVVGVLVVMAPVHILTHFGNESLDYVSPGELAGFAYVSSTLPPANLFGGYPAGNFENTAILDARNSYLSRGVIPASIEDFLDPTLHHGWSHKDWPTYVLLSRGDAAALDLFQDRPGFMAEVKAVLDQRPEFTVVYSNPDITVYRWQPDVARRQPCNQASCSTGGVASMSVKARS